MAVRLVGALLFAATAARSALLGDPVFAGMQGVLAALGVAMGVGITCTA